ncbi:MAG: restriction endonuclease [Gammaproteobacteria bacterium]|nr:MAG: restriction endonuclease [Gammaproteobacteria bacterium]
MPTYISLFSGAGVGCYGFKLENFNCISTVEILKKRLSIQMLNNKCLFESGYICGDIRNTDIKDRLKNNLKNFLKNSNRKELDVLIATPPCQGMSVANHKKKHEKSRNSLVVESITLTKKFLPRFFIFENVSSFLNTICTDVDGKDKKISKAIQGNLSGNYNIFSKIINFKNYGNNSSRTRTIVIGVRKDQQNITPFDLFPDMQKEKKLYDVIGKLPSLKIMGEILKEDIYHQFKKYTPHMRNWISGIKEGESAFDNADENKIPHRIVNGKIVINQNKNGDKYKRQSFNKVAPCIHTRNDILSSQNTIHPKDDRVFSIREVMKMMTIPKKFRWGHQSKDELNNLSLIEKQLYLKKEEMNIRQSIGEAVPTKIFQQIANKIKKQILKKNITKKDVLSIVDDNDLKQNDHLKLFIESNELKLDYTTLLTIAELSNSKRIQNSAYYTTQNIVYSIVKRLPDSKNYKNLSILEPSVGIGAFLPLLLKKYEDVNSVTIDVIDVDSNSIELLKIMLKKIKIPHNIKINFLNDDFLTHKFNKKYDIVVGNPPFGKIIKNKKKLSKYTTETENKKTNNIFSFFIEKSLKVGKAVALIVPKSLLSSPEFNKTREILSKYNIKCLIDYGEKGFSGVKIETISFVLDAAKKSNSENMIEVESYITNNIKTKKQKYIFDKNFPYWLIYRNHFFDSISNKLIFNIFMSFRDRQITKKHTTNIGKIRVLKSRNIKSNKIINIPDYDCFVNDVDNFSVGKFLNKPDLVLIPNLTYNPRACFLPKNSITDGSLAILSPKDNKINITNKDLDYFNTDEFSKFYSIARNRGTRSLNIDNNSVFYFGKLKQP